MYVWRRNQAKNLLSPENRQRITHALAAGSIFGYWYRSHSGFGPVHWIAHHMDDLTVEVAQAKPGDLYVIWSVPALMAKNLALAAARYGDTPAASASLLAAADMRAIAAYLNDPHNEFIALCFGTERGPEVVVNDRDDLEYIAELAEWYNKPGGQIYVYPYTTIDGPQYWLLEAQYPNERGEVRQVRTEATQSSARAAKGVWLVCATLLISVVAAVYFLLTGRKFTTRGRGG